MIRTLTCLLLISLGTSFPAMDLATVPADHRWVVQLDLAQVMQGRIGGFLAAAAAKPPLKEKLAAITAITGFDPLTQCQRITLSGTDATETQAVMVAQGTFDGKRLETLVAAMEGHEALAAGSRVIHRWKEDGRGHIQYGTVVDNRLLVVGRDEQQLRAVLAVIDGAAKPAVLKDLLGSEAPVVNAPLVMLAANGFATWQGMQPQAAMFKQARAMLASIAEEGDTLQFRGMVAANDEKAAQSMVDLANGLLAMAHLSPPQQLDPALKAIADSADVARDGTTVTMSMSLPVQMVLARLQHLQKATERRKDAPPAEGSTTPANNF